MKLHKSFNYNNNKWQHKIIKIPQKFYMDCKIAPKI